MIQGSSIDKDIAARVKKEAAGKEKILVCLDSNHTHEHVLQELELYSSLVSQGSYLVVFDTIVEDLPEDYLPGRAWSVGDNPKTAVKEFLMTHSEFVIDTGIDDKLLISVAPGGYLKRIK
jgi:cephalosporin hydroxylase